MFRPRNCGAGDSFANVRNVLRETGLEPACLELELTETFLLQDQYTAVAVLHSLHGIGVRLSLDDFGTGYSSLSHLKRFPIDALKIDQSFVRGLASDAADVNIVSAIIAMGRSLQVRVTAEGIERRSSSLSFKSEAVQTDKGSCLGGPLDAGAISRLLRSAELERASAHRRSSSRSRDRSHGASSRHRSERYS